MSAFDKLANLYPKEAIALDAMFVYMAPTPLADDADQEERDAFEAQLNAAEMATEAVADYILSHN